MPDRLVLPSVGLEQALLRLVIDEHRRGLAPRLERYWTYFRNASEAVGVAPRTGGRSRLAQEAGLPARLRATGADPRLDDRWRASPEIVIENDIAWRIQTMVDFLMGRALRIRSDAADPALAERIERALSGVWEASGGVGLLQDMALIGHVYGHADLLVRVRDVAGGAPAEAVGIELVEPVRGVPLVSAHDYRSLDAYCIVTEQELPELDQDSSRPSRRRAMRIEVLGPGWRQVIQDGEIIEEGAEPWFEGAIPIAHAQNVAQPFHYEGLGEVEPLIPLQDELNTRLSDRASRVTLQSFRMYLAKGLDGFDGSLIGPGRVFSTDNPEAAIHAFGGDSDSPSEARHVEEIREAMDKASGVPPLAGGVVRARLGNLSSATALRITLLSLLARTARKRITYGRAVTEASRLVLAALDAAGILRTRPGDRALRLEWPDPLPEDLADRASPSALAADVGDRSGAAAGVPAEPRRPAASGAS